MTPNWEWFSTLSPIEGRVVNMENDSFCNVVGIGNIQFKQHDGTHIPLTEVKYVPEMEKYLISLGMLESKGLRYGAEGRVLIVTKDGSTVMTRKRTGGNIYILQRYTN